MKMIRIFPYIPGGLLLLLILWVNYTAIGNIFDSPGRAGFVGIFILLEGVLIAWLHFMCGRTVDCAPEIERSIKLFYLSFLALGVCSVISFAIHDGVNVGLEDGMLKGVFWLLFIVLVSVGGRLVLYLFKIIRGNEQASFKPNTTASESLYGRAGYGSSK